MGSCSGWGSWGGSGAAGRAEGAEEEVGPHAARCGAAEHGAGPPARAWLGVGVEFGLGLGTGRDRVRVRVRVRGALPRALPARVTPLGVR